MRKGISPVIASIILILIVLSLSSAYLTFTGRLSGGQTEAAQKQSQELTQTIGVNFRIAGVENQDVLVRNIGADTIPQNALTVIVDDTAMNYTSSGDIPKGATGRLTLMGLWKIGPGERTLRVEGAPATDSLLIDLEPADGNVLDLGFEEGSGTTAADSSGSSNDGILTNGPTWSTDTPLDSSSSSLRFNGTDDYVNVSDSPSLTFAGNRLTAEFWVNPGSITTQMFIVSKRDDAPQEREFDIAFDPVGAAKWFEFRIFGSGGSNVTRFSSNHFSTGVWSHVVSTYDGSTLRIWVGGVLASENASTINLGDTPQPITLGVLEDSTGLGSFFNGQLDEVRIYNRAYTPDELYVLKPA